MPVKQPQDHKPPQRRRSTATRGAKAEAQRNDITFTFEGVDYTIDRDNAKNLELMEFAEDGEYIKAIRGFVGRDQWVKFKDSQRDDAGRVSTDSFQDFLNAVMEAVGGNS